MLAFETEHITNHPLNTNGKDLIHRVTIDLSEERQFKTNQGAELNSHMGLEGWWEPSVASRLTAGMPGAGNNRMIGKLLSLTQKNLGQFIELTDKALADLQKLDPQAAQTAMGTLPDGTTAKIEFGDQIYIFVCVSDRWHSKRILH